MKRTWTGIALALVLFFTAVRPAAAIFDKTRFLAHIGIAYFVFHHWVMAPYHAGSFQAGAPHRTKAIIKAGVAMLFAIHEIKKANAIAHDSNSPILQKLAGSIDSVQSTFATVGDRLKNGIFQAADVGDTAKQLSDVSSKAAASGLHIHDVSVPVPGI